MVPAAGPQATRRWWGVAYTFREGAAELLLLHPTARGKADATARDPPRGLRPANEHAVRPHERAGLPRARPRRRRFVLTPPAVRHAAPPSARCAQARRPFASGSTPGPLGLPRPSTLQHDSHACDRARPSAAAARQSARAPAPPEDEQSLTARHRSATPGEPAQRVVARARPSLQS